MIQLNLHGSCYVCGKNFQVGDTKVITGTLMGAVGTFSVGLAGMNPSSLKFYCIDCAKTVFADNQGGEDIKGLDKAEPPLLTR